MRGDNGWENVLDDWRLFITKGDILTYPSNGLWDYFILASCPRDWAAEDKVAFVFKAGMYLGIHHSVANLGSIIARKSHSGWNKEKTKLGLYCAFSLIASISFGVKDQSQRSGSDLDYLVPLLWFSAVKYFVPFSTTKCIVLGLEPVEPFKNNRLWDLVSNNLSHFINSIIYCYLLGLAINLFLTGQIIYPFIGMMVSLLVQSGLGLCGALSKNKLYRSTLFIGINSCLIALHFERLESKNISWYYSLPILLLGLIVVVMNVLSIALSRQPDILLPVDPDQAVFNIFTSFMLRNKNDAQFYISLLSSENQEIRVVAAAATSILGDDKVSLSEVNERDRQVLAQLLSDPNAKVRKNIATTFYNLIINSNYSQVVNKSVIQNLIELIYDDNMQVVNSAADALRAILDGDKVSLSKVNERERQVLAQLLSDPNAKVRKNIATTFYNLIINSDYSQVVNKSVIRNLIELIYDDNMQVVNSAADALRAIATDAERRECGDIAEASGPLTQLLDKRRLSIKTTVLDLIIMLQLMHLLNHNDESIVKSAIMAAVNLAPTDERNRKLIFSSGGVVALNVLYEQDPVSFREDVSNALHNLAHFEFEAIDLLINSLCDQDAETRIKSLSVLAELAKNSLFDIKTLIKKAVIENVICFLSDQDSTARRNSILILSKLSGFAVSHAWIVEHVSIPLLLYLLSDPDPLVSRYSSIVIENLSSNASQADSITDHGGDGILIDLLSNIDPVIRRCAATAIWNLCYQRDTITDGMIGKGVVDPLLKLLNDKESAVRDSADAAVEYLRIRALPPLSSCVADMLSCLDSSMEDAVLIASLSSQLSDNSLSRLIYIGTWVGVMRSLLAIMPEFMRYTIADLKNVYAFFSCVFSSVIMSGIFFPSGSIGIGLRLWLILKQLCSVCLRYIVVINCLGKFGDNFDSFYTFMTFLLASPYILALYYQSPQSVAVVIGVSLAIQFPLRVFEFGPNAYFYYLSRLMLIAGLGCFNLSMMKKVGGLFDSRIDSIFLAVVAFAVISLIPKFLSALLREFQSQQRAGINAMRFVAETENAQIFLALRIVFCRSSYKSVIHTLTRMISLDAESWEVPCESLRALAQQSIANKDIIARHSGVEMAINLLKKLERAMNHLTDSRLKRYIDRIRSSINFLAEIADCHLSNQGKIAQAGGIDLFIRFLQQNRSEIISVSAANALLNTINYYPDNKLIAIEAGLVEQALLLLERDDAGLQHCALKLLSAVTLDMVAAHQRVMSSGGTDILMRCLSNNSEDISLGAAIVLANLMVNIDIKAQIYSFDEAKFKLIMLLVPLVDRTLGDYKEKINQALDIIGLDDPVAKERIRDLRGQSQRTEVADSQHGKLSTVCLLSAGQNGPDSRPDQGGPAAAFT